MAIGLGVKAPLGQAFSRHARQRLPIHLADAA
jgi:hypothetical protein